MNAVGQSPSLMSASPASDTVRTTTSTCCYCGVGCGVLISSQRNAEGQEQIIGVRGDPDHPANFGRLCTKGATLHLTAAPHLYAQVRAAQPELRRNRTELRQTASWDETLEYVATRFADIVREHGKESVGVYVSGQLLTEDYYVFNKLVKGLIGTNQIDTNSRLCMSSAVAGYKQTLGADAPPCSYEDIDHAEVMFIVGSNMAFAHPILFRRVEAAKAKNPNLRIIVADPRKTDTADSADLFLQIQPGTDVALFHGMLHIMLWEGWVDEAYVAAHTEGFAELKALVRDYTPKTVAQLCGIREADLVEATRLFATSKATLSMYCQGLNQSSSGTLKNAALVNLHLATRQIGKVGAGPFSLTGQPNAMGGREVGGLANLLSAHRDLSKPEHRAEVAALWGVPDVPEKPGLTAVEMFENLGAAGDASKPLKAIWIVCTNPAQSLPNQADVRRALAEAEFVVVQEAYQNTATVPYADVLLPATTWGEKTGTVTNSERRISRVRPAVTPFGQARDDWQIAVQVAHRLEAKIRPNQPTLFPYETAEQVWNEHRESTRGRDLDITGLSYAILETQGPQQWPMPEGASQGKARLYEDGVFPTASGRAKFVAGTYRAVSEPVDARYPFALLTGRLRDQWHGGSRTSTLARLFSHAPEPCVQIAQRDFQRLQLQEGDLVHVTSRRGSQILPARSSAEVATGQAFVAMHWGEEFVSGAAGSKDGAHLSYGVNTLTLPALDPSSKQPELKHAAVKLLKAELPWQLVTFAWMPRPQALSTQTALRALFAKFAYASCVLFGREVDAPAVAGETDQVGVLLRVADYEACSPEIRQQIEDLLGFDAKTSLRYGDPKRGTGRCLQVRDDHIVAVLLSGARADVAAEVWLRPYLEEGQSAMALGRMLLMPGSKAPAGMASRGKVICNCFNVGEAAIQAHLAGCAPALSADACMASLQKTLECGTNCGSCVPELKRMILQTKQAA